jgi:mono/diheme cytochrome c family protein
MRCRGAAIRAALALGLTALALPAAGCGGSGPTRSSSSAAGHPAGTSQLPPGSVAGRELFARDCAFCHSLSGHNSPKQQGGDLLGAHLRRPVLVQFTAEMPVKHRLSRADLNAVVDYVIAVQRRSGQG